MPETPEPTEHDRENASRRQEIADKQAAEYGHCLRLALGVLGPGWTPWMKLCLIDSDYYLRHGAPPEPVATVYKVYHGKLRLSENSVYVMEKDGKTVWARSYEELLGDLLFEKH